MVRVVLDTNILVSGIFFHGLPGRVLDAWLDRKFSIFVTPTILEEYARVMQEFTAGKRDVDIIEWMDTLLELCHVVPDSSKAVAHVRDPHDDKFVNCALRAKANYLVTGDKDLLVLKEKFPVKIVSPRKFLNSIPT